MQKRIALLGSTGSIGTQSLEVIKGLQNDKIVALTAASNVDLLEKQVREFLPEVVAMRCENAADKLKSRLQNLKNPPVILFGENAAHEAVLQSSPQLVLNAVVGIAGLSATVGAVSNGIDVALANKESLVTGGKLVMQAAKKTGAKLLPVDSEHSAIFQCLQDDNSKSALKKIILTASGGPFYGMSTKELAMRTSADALKHPNWSMGNKITIDSASLMNKGLEFIEAMWLFDVEPEKIEIVVHKESIIHSMVEFEDNAILAQLGVPDMRIPIQYALTWPKRFKGKAPKLEFNKIKQLSFDSPDEETFRCLAACKKAAKKGGLAPCAVNGANEEAVSLFLKDKIGFLDIGRLVEACLESDSFAGEYDLSDVYNCDKMARAFVHNNC